MNTPTTLQVVDHTEAASTLLNQVRLRVLEALGDGGSATTVARELELPRQKVNYHVRKLEQAGLVEQVGERRKGNCTERIVRATARSYLVGPRALGKLGTDPRQIRDRFSTDYLVALAARTVNELSEIRERADAKQQTVPVLAIDTEIRFASPAARQQFTNQLATAVADLISRFHDENAEGGRRFRLGLQSYPKPAQRGETDDQEDP